MTKTTTTSDTTQLQKVRLMKNKIVTAVAGLFALVVFAGCESFTYEAEPVESDNNGKNPEKVKCFAIEADSSNGDDGDKQLGTFCKKDN